MTDNNIHSFTQNHLKVLWLVVWRSLLVIMLLFTMLEISARVLLEENPELRRSFGFRNTIFEIKWFQIQEYVEQNDGVDLIILGSSLAHTGIDPAVMEKIIFERTGYNLRIYNFGIDGLTMPAIEDIGRVLVAKYHPEILVLVSELRDFDADNGILEQTLFQNTPWMIFQRGRFSLSGWLVNNSIALQLFLPYRNWMTPTFDSQTVEYDFRASSLWENGYEANNGANRIAERSINPFRPGEKYLITMFESYAIDSSQLQCFSDFLEEMEFADVQVILAVWPFPVSAFDSPGGLESLTLYTNTIGALSEELNVDVISPLPEDSIPGDGRSDRYHFNRLGAEVYSQYLGSQISELDWFRNVGLPEQ
jgi:hypothetical protein